MFSYNTCKVTRIHVHVDVSPFHRQVYCPCDARFEHCSAMHSRDEIVSIFVRDTHTFRELLDGDDSIQSA